MAIRRHILLGVLPTFLPILVAPSKPAWANDDQNGFLWSNLVELTQIQIVQGMTLNVTFIAFVLGLLSYIVIFLIFRRRYIVAPELESLCAARRTLDAILNKDTEDATEPSIDNEPANNLLQSSRECLSDEEIERWYGVLPWHAASARYCAAWRLLHEAEREIAESEKHASPCRAMTVLSRLKEIEIDDKDIENVTLQLNTYVSNPDKEKARSILPWVQEGEAFLCRAEQVRIQAIQEARNKAFWLVVSAVACVFWLGLMIKASAPVLLAGAIGGLLARLSIAVQDKGTVFDYSVSWMVLFLTPLVGAIAGWFGVAIVELSIEIAASEYQGNVDLTNPNGFAFLVAFLFGWSARLFDAAANKLEGELTRTLQHGGFAKRGTGADQMSTQR